ncbi:MAG TPA: bifunctional enoyl-CoA hydratase/phosphate acetyltransferase [Burkholderiales bacterium]|nr:bifunctional enoyl-CoA hydratase/phosphate acetyltransferase [Burkholderiales bacterium]
MTTATVSRTSVALGKDRREYIENRTFDEIKVGDSASLQRTLGTKDIQLFAVMSGDVNPAHVDAEYAASSMFREVIAHGMWGGALISTVLGTIYPGPGTVYIDQTLHFSRPVTIGDTITVTVTVKEKFERTRHVILDCTCTNQEGRVVIRGTAEVLAPAEKVRRRRTKMPEVRLHDTAARYQKLIDLTKGCAPITMAVVHPCDAQSLGGALSATEAGLIKPILIGPRAKMLAVAKELGVDLSSYELVDVEHSHAAAAKGVELVRAGRADALMKGSLHTDELMGEVVASSTGLRTARRISHVFFMDVPAYPKPLLITDAAVNVEPDLDAKVDIIQNAIDLALALNIIEPKVAILAAVETVNSKMRATIDAAALCKMAERGQIRGGIVDGPLAFDNAVSFIAAKTKGITSAVAGQADILVVPDLEAGNMIAKQLEYLADAASAGIVLGARVPIVLTSRADHVPARVASCAIALLLAHRKAGAA